MLELWHRLRQRGYSRCPESLFRVMRKLGLFPAEKPKKKYKPKPYEQMTHPGERVQVGCRGRSPPLHRRPGASPVPVHRYRRVHTDCAFWRRIRSNPPIPRRTSCAGCGRGTPAEAYKWECVQTDNGFEFTNRFSNSKRDLPTLFEKTAAELGIRHKLIRPYTPRHNGKVERSHREDQKRFYSCHSFYSLEDFEKQLATHNRRANNLPMRPLHWLSPIEFAVQYV